MPARRRRLARMRRPATFGAGAGATLLLGIGGVATAAVPVLSTGHAYCFYFSSTGSSGGMHLVAAAPAAISPGPSNFVSGSYGVPQDTVVFVNCLTRSGAAAGTAYLGFSRIALHNAGGSLHFARHLVARGLHRIGVPGTGTVSVTVTLTGTVIANGSSAGAIVGTLHLAAPGCLPHPVTYHYTGV